MPLTRPSLAARLADPMATRALELGPDLDQTAAAGRARRPARGTLLARRAPVIRGVGVGHDRIAPIRRGPLWISRIDPGRIGHRAPTRTAVSVPDQPRFRSISS